MKTFQLLTTLLVLAALSEADVESGQEPEPGSDSAAHPAAGKAFSVFGICRDEKQQPLAGVKVGLWKRPRAQRGERIAEVSTGEDGRFRLDNLPAPTSNASTIGWSYTLVTSLAGRESRIHTIPAASGVEQVVNMAAAATLMGRVFGPNENPVEGAIVWSGDADETMTLFGVRSAKTDADGRFSISDVRGEKGAPVGDSVVVLHPDFAQQRVRYPDDPGQLGIRLKEGSIVRGRVVDGFSGVPASKVVVTARYVRPSDRVVGLSSPDELKDVRETLTDEQGEFRFSGLGGNARYVVRVTAENRVPLSNETVLTTPGGSDTLPDLKLVQGGVIEGRILTLKGEPLSRDGQTGDRLSVKVSQNSVVDVDDDGCFRVRVAAGKHRMQIQSLSIWERTWRRSVFENGIEIAEGQTLPVTFRVGEKTPPRPRPERVDRGKVPLPEPVPSERWAANEIRELGGWYKLDAGKHVVEINMVYHEHEGTRYDNAYTNSDEALRAAQGFPRLERLFLHKAQATDDAMAAIENLKELRMFFVWDAEKLTDAGVRHLAGLEKLENIHLSNGGLGDETLEVLSLLPSLKTMSLQGNAFTDEGLARVAVMEQVESLWVGLGKTKITDVGLAHLQGLQNLKTLDVQKTGVTDKGVTELKGALPTLQQVFK